MGHYASTERATGSRSLLCSPSYFFYAEISHHGMTNQNHRIYTMIFAKVYPLYINKAEKKGRTKTEVDETILWLTGYTSAQFEAQLKKEADMETFFREAPQLNP